MPVFQITIRNPSRTVLTGAAFALLSAAAAQAQTSGDTPLPLLESPPSVESYSLPPGPGSNSAQEKLQGPVDPEIPLAKPTIVPPRTSSPSASPPTQRKPQPDRQDTAPAPTESSSADRQPARQPAPTAPPSQDIAAKAADSADAQPEPATDEPQQPAARPEEADLTPTTSATESGPEHASGNWGLWMVAVLLFALLGGILLWRKRQIASARPIDEPLAPKPTAGTHPQPGNVTKFAEPLAPAPTITIGFQPRSANATLINAVLNFEITLSNPGSEDLSDIRITGAMAQARDHGGNRSVSAEFAPLGEVQHLRNGEKKKVITEFRIPLNSIDPIIFQSQALFVPMVQLAVEFTGRGGSEHVQTASFLVGREHQPPRPRMAPFRLDQGPRSFAPLGFRALPVG